MNEEMQDKLECLTHKQLIEIINWTVQDLDNAAKSEHYRKLDYKVKGWCAMLSEAMLHQINKAYNNNSKGEEQ